MMMASTRGGHESRMSIRAHLGAVWAAVVAITIAVVATYALLPASDFYHVSHEGLAGGTSRALVYSNFPVSLVGLALIGVSLILLHSHPERGLLAVAGAVGAVLCLVTVAPGVVKQSDLDARLINVVPFIGSVIAVALTVLAMREPAAEQTIHSTWKDRVGFGIVIVLTVVALPWILADVGVYIGDIPGLGSIFYSKQIPAGETLRAVHLGHHHGLDGLLFAFVAVVIGRVVRSQEPAALVNAMAAYCGLMLSYGIANVANDAWLEQVVKRGWTEWEIPSFLSLDPSLGWGVVLIGAAAAWAFFFRPEREASRTSRARAVVQAA